VRIFGEKFLPILQLEGATILFAATT